MKAEEYVKTFNDKFLAATELPKKELQDELINVLSAFIAEFDNTRKKLEIDQGSKVKELADLIIYFNKKWKETAIGINSFFMGKFKVEIVNDNAFLNMLKIFAPTYELTITTYNIV